MPRPYQRGGLRTGVASVEFGAMMGGESVWRAIAPVVALALLASACPPRPGINRIKPPTSQQILGNGSPDCTAGAEYDRG